jgi:hypothetical protein
VQLEELVHETPFKMFSIGERFGVDSTDHFVPFQCSARFRSSPEVMILKPTAVQLEALVHTTPSSELEGKPAGLGGYSAFHLDPFQCSAKAGVLADVPGEWYPPTAMQLVGLPQATASKTALVGAGTAMRCPANAAVGEDGIAVARTAPTNDATSGNRRFRLTMPPVPPGTPPAPAPLNVI